MFFAVCGFLGHVQEECGSGEHTPEAVVFSKWLLADTSWNRSQLHGGARNRLAGRGARPEMGRGSGRAGMVMGGGHGARHGG
jgi:hypothetical protein